MKKYLLILASLFLIVSCSKEADNKIVAITQIATHPALDEVRRGIVEGLAKKGFINGTNITIVFRNANGDPSLTLPIAQDFVRKNAAVIVPISTPSALGAARSTQTIPIVFSGVTDPIGVGLVDDLNNPKGNITGVSDRWPFEKQIQTYLDFYPNNRKIGMLYTQGDDVSQIGINAVNSLVTKLDFELIKQPISSPIDVYPSAVAMLKKVDVIYTGIDHLILENLESLIKASNEANKPIFGGESGSVEKGAVLAITINMYDFGVMTSDLISKVLNGIPPSNIPITVVSEGDLFVNKQSAFKFNLDTVKANTLNAKYYEEIK